MNRRVKLPVFKDIQTFCVMIAIRYAIHYRILIPQVILKVQALLK